MKKHYTLPGKKYNIQYKKKTIIKNYGKNNRFKFYWKYF